MKKLLVAILAFGLMSCDKELGGGDGPINIPTSTTLTGNINTTTTLTADKVWTLKGYVYVTDGAKLIIQPGTTIVSDISEKGALVIERGAQIVAEGTATKPIVFTSGKAVGERAPGDWGGIVILGRAKTMHLNSLVERYLQEIYTHSQPQMMILILILDTLEQSQMVWQKETHNS